MNMVIGQVPFFAFVSVYFTREKKKKKKKNDEVNIPYQYQ